MFKMNKKRLIITGILSILLVVVLMLGSTYSIFTSSEVDENLNVYTTGNLDVTYTVSDDVYFEDITPMTTSEAEAVFPYRLTVTNVGTVPYQFDVILNDTTSTDSINYKYIMTKVGYLEPKALSDCASSAIVEDVVIPAGESVDIDIRIWLDESLPNSMIGNSFYANLVVEGLAVYDNTSYVNNDQLSLRYMKLLFETPLEEDYAYFKVDTYREKIKNVYFVDYIDTSDVVVESWDLSVKGDNSIIGWVSNNATDGYYNLYIGSDEDIYANSLMFLFSDMTGIETISFDNLNTSLTTDMSYVFASLFYW